jgi:kynureninase
VTSRADLLALDRADPLAPFRERFLLPGGVIYLDGNSLGALPRTTPDVMTRVVTEEWGRGLITSWNRHGWVDLPQTVGDMIAPLIGAGPGEVVACDSTSINLLKLLAAALDLRPGRHVIVAERDGFPTDLYMAQGLRQLVPDLELRLVGTEALAASLGPEVAVLLVNHVDYRSGRIADMAGLTRAAHDSGALALFDLAHSAGAIEVDLEACGADLAVGCGYKFLNGGPGAPAFLYVAGRHQHARQPLAGWFGHAAPFEFEPRYRPADGIARFLTGTPGILGLRALAEGVRITALAGPARLAAKARALGDVFLDLVAARCPSLEPACPREGRGSQVSFRHPEAYPVMQALISRGVIGDVRRPDILRFGLAPLYNRFVDVDDAVDQLADILDTGAWDRPEHKRREKVT